jgi:hypothetical protein
MIFTFVLSAWSVLGASFGPVVILALVWKRTTRQGAVAGLLIGSLVSVIWNNIGVLSAALYEIVPAFILSFAGVVIVSLMTQPSEIEARERERENEIPIESFNTQSRFGLVRVDDGNKGKSPSAVLEDQAQRRHEEQEGGVLSWGKNCRSTLRQRVFRRHSFRDVGSRIAGPAD